MIFKKKKEAGNGQSQMLELEITGMTCPSCAEHVEQALRQVPGVVSAEVPDWQAGKALVAATADVAEKALTRSVSKAGYQARRVTRRAW